MPTAMPKVMRSPVLKRLRNRMLQAQGEVVPIADLKKVVGKTRRPQGVMWELKRHGYDVKIEREKHRALGYLLRRVPRDDQSKLAEKFRVKQEQERKAKRRAAAKKKGKSNGSRVAQVRPRKANVQARKVTAKQPAAPSPSVIEAPQT